MQIDIFLNKVMLESVGQFIGFRVCELKKLFLSQLNLSMLILPHKKTLIGYIIKGKKNILIIKHDLN